MSAVQPIHRPPEARPTSTEARGAGWIKTVRLLASCGRQLRRLLEEHVERAALGDAEFLLLTALHDAEAEGIAQSELASQIGVSPAQISGLIERLRQQGWLSVERSARDRRRQTCRLTPEGEQLVQRVLGELTSLVDQLDSQVSPAARQQLDEFLRRLSEAPHGGPSLSVFSPANLPGRNGGGCS